MSMKLVILGILMEGEKHPYEIQHIMKEREMDQYIKLQKGSLYYAVEQLEKQKFIEVVDVIRDSNRPDRTIYRITAAGKEEFQRILLAQFASTQRVYHPMYAALAFARYGDQEKIAELIEEKIKQLEHHIAIMQATYDKHVSKVSRATLHIMLGAVEHGETELRWLKRLKKDAVEGRLRERGTPIE
jgi:DNA-binding PadR family transcriptional regulator